MKEYVSQCIESVLAQPYPNVEVIVVDDGSTDGTAEVVDSFQGDRRVHILHQANSGSAAARNAGARIARGELLAFLDGDDLATGKRLLAAVEQLEQHRNAALAYGRIDLVDEAGQMLASRNNPSRYRSGWVANDLRYRNFIPFSTITLRREVFWALGGLDEGIRSSEDWEFLFRLATRHPVVFVNECLALYRVRSGSKTMDVEAKERAIRAVQERIFASPPPAEMRRALPHLADACRWMGLAGTLVKRGELRHALQFFFRAVSCHPGVLVVYRSEIWDGLRRLAARNSMQASREGMCIRCRESATQTVPPESKVPRILIRLLSRCLRAVHLDLVGRFSFITADGCQFWLHDEVESHSLWVGSETDDLSTFLRQHLHEGNTFVDIGANVGRYTILASRLVGPAGSVYTFEPAPTAFRHLQQNLQLNHCENVRAFCLAIAESPGAVDFWEYRRSSALNGMFARSEHRARSKTPCEAITGKDVLSLMGPSRTDVLKIDAEGAELPILRGFGERLTEVGCIVFECSRANAARAGYTVRNLLMYLEDAGRNLYELGGGGSLRRITAADYDAVNRNLIAVLVPENL